MTDLNNREQTIEHLSNRIRKSWANIFYYSGYWGKDSILGSQEPDEIYLRKDIKNLAIDIYDLLVKPNLKK
jgi:hypothetical protein